MTRKVFRALTSSVVEKLFIGADEPAPEGWHETQKAALEAFEEPAPLEVTEPAPEPPVKRGPGRPRKNW